jgi:hypothetical protein
MMGSGVFAGASNPNQGPLRKSRPLSIKVGTSGNSGERRSAASAMALS